MGENIVRNEKLDWVKSGCAILIIFIHISFPGKLGYIMDSLARIGVPLFFIVSGYYCDVSDEKCVAKIRKKIQRMCILLLSLTVIYIIFYMLFFNDWDKIIEYLRNFIYPRNILYTILFNMVYAAGHLWFISALMYTYVIYYFAVKKGFVKVMYKLIIPLLFMQILLGECLSALSITLDTPLSRNFIFIGIPFFTIGVYIRDKEDYIIHKFKRKQVSIIFFASFFIQAIERVLVSKTAWGTDLYVSSIISAIALFVICLYPTHIGRHFGGEIQKFPEFCYFFHPMIGTVLYSKLFNENGREWKNCKLFYTDYIVCNNDYIIYCFGQKL